MHKQAHTHTHMHACAHTHIERGVLQAQHMLCSVLNMNFKRSVNADGRGPTIPDREKNALPSIITRQNIGGYKARDLASAGVLSGATS